MRTKLFLSVLAVLAFAALGSSTASASAETLTLLNSESEPATEVAFPIEGNSFEAPGGMEIWCETSGAVLNTVVVENASSPVTLEEANPVEFPCHTGGFYPERNVTLELTEPMRLYPDQTGELPLKVTIDTVGLEQCTFAGTANLTWSPNAALEAISNYGVTLVRTGGHCFVEASMEGWFGSPIADGLNGQKWVVS